MEGSGFALFEEKSPSRQFRGGSGKEGRRPSQGRQIQLLHLWENHHRMLRLALLGMSNAEIGRELGCTAVTVSNCLNSSLGKQRLSEMRAAVDKKSCDTAVRLRELNEKALEVLEEILENEDAPMGLRAKVAMDNLSRTGFAPQINVKGTFDHRHFGPDEIERIKLFAIEAAKRQGCLILAEQATDVRLIAGQGSSNSQGSSDHGAGEQVDNQDTDVTIDIG